MLGWGLRFFLKIVFMKLQIPKVGLGFLEEKKFMQWNTILNVRILGEEYIQWNHTINVTIMIIVVGKKTFKQWNYTMPNVKVRVQEKTICAMKIHNTKY
jgi:hypothetical protein